MEEERPIEKLLRAYARRRREEAGAPPELELRPAARRRLQLEVARRYGERERAAMPLWRRLAALWPRLAWGLGVLTLLGLAAALLVPGPNRTPGAGSPMRLARNSPAAAPAPAPLPVAETDRAALPLPARTALASAPVAAQGRGSAGPAVESAAARKPGVSPAVADQVRAPSQEVEQRALALADAPAPASASAARQSSARRMGGPAGRVVSSLADGVPQLATAPAATKPQAEGSLGGMAAAGPVPSGEAAASETSAPVNVQFAARSRALAGSTAQPVAYARKGPSATPGLAGREKDGVVVLHFTQLAPRTNQFSVQADLSDKAVWAAPVLAAFQLEQSGARLLVTDGDGSVYTGYVQPAGPVNGLDSLTPTPALQPVRPEPEMDFRQNRELRAATAPAITPSATQYYYSQYYYFVRFGQNQGQNYSFRVAGTNRSLQQKVVFSGTLMNLTNAPQARGARIWGKALVGTGQEIQVDAVSRKGTD